MIKCECTILNIFNFFNALCEAPVSHSGSLRPDQPRKNGRRSSGAGIMFLTEAGRRWRFQDEFCYFSICTTVHVEICTIGIEFLYSFYVLLDMYYWFLIDFFMRLMRFVFGFWLGSDVYMYWFLLDILM